MWMTLIWNMKSNINKHSKNILIFSHHRFPFLCLFCTKKKRSFSLNLKNREREKLVYVLIRYMLLMLLLFPKQNKTKKKKWYKCFAILLCAVLYIYFFNIIILIAYVALVNKRISQFIGWHVCQWHLSTISHSNIFLIYHFISRKIFTIGWKYKKGTLGYNLHLNARFLVRFYCDYWMQFNDKNVFH